MACDISIRNSRLFKSPLSIADIIGKENWVYGTLDDCGRIEVGKNDGSGPLVIYDPASIGRGVQIENIESKTEILLSLPLPATENDVRMLYCAAGRIASLWKSGIVFIDEEKVKVSDLNDCMERDMTVNAGLFNTLKESLEEGGITLFCARLPICVT